MGTKFGILSALQEKGGLMYSNVMTITAQSRINRRSYLYGKLQEGIH